MSYIDQSIDRNKVSAGRAFMAWLAVVALFVQTLVPLQAAYAFDQNQDGTVQVICTVNGIATISLDVNGNPVQNDTNPETNSCPFCVLHDAAGISAPAQKSVLSAWFTPSPVRFTQPASHTLSSIWQGGIQPSRAPPLVSI